MKSLRMLVGLLGSPWKHVLGPGLPVLMWDHGRLLLLLLLGKGPCCRQGAACRVSRVFARPCVETLAGTGAYPLSLSPTSITARTPHTTEVSSRRNACSK